MKNVILGIILSMVLGTTAFAANYNNPIEGKLKAVYSDFITISIPSDMRKSRDANASSQGDLDITINSQTACDNFLQLSDLRQGDTVSVAYDQKRISGYKKVATRITRVQVADPATSPTITTTKTTVTTTTVKDTETNP